MPPVHTSKIKNETKLLIETEFVEKYRVKRTPPDLTARAADVLLVFLCYSFEERGPSYGTVAIPTPKLMSSKLLHSFRYHCKTRLKEDGWIVEFIHFAMYPREKKEWITVRDYDSDEEEFVCL